MPWELTGLSSSLSPVCDAVLTSADAKPTASSCRPECTLSLAETTRYSLADNLVLNRLGVQAFFCYRLLHLSQRNWYLVGTLGAIATGAYGSSIFSPSCTPSSPFLPPSFY